MGVAKAPEVKEVKVFRPKPRERGVKVSKVGGEFVITAPGLERLTCGPNAGPGELRWQLNYQLKRLGADKVLEKAGAKPGDKLRCGELTWEW